MIISHGKNSYSLGRHQAIDLLSLPIREKRGVTEADFKRVGAKPVAATPPLSVEGKTGDALAVMLAEVATPVKRAPRKPKVAS